MGRSIHLIILRDEQILKLQGPYREHAANNSLSNSGAAQLYGEEMGIWAIAWSMPFNAS